MALVVWSAKSPEIERLKRAPERSFRLGAHLVTMEQRWKPGGDGGTMLGHGASVFDAAFVLADFLFRANGECGGDAIPGYPAVAGKRVIELGTGPGLGAVACGLLNAAEVVATDGDAELPELTKVNLVRNLSADRVEVQQSARARCQCRTAQLMWGDEAKARELCAALRRDEQRETKGQQKCSTGQPAFDVVLAADCAACVYEGAFEMLVASFLHLTGLDSVVVLSYQRRHSSEDAFFALAEEHFTVERVPRQHLHPDFQFDKEPLPSVVPSQSRFVATKFSEIDVYLLRRRRAQHPVAAVESWDIRSGNKTRHIFQGEEKIVTEKNEEEERI